MYAGVDSRVCVWISKRVKANGQEIVEVEEAPWRRGEKDVQLRTFCAQKKEKKERKSVQRAAHVEGEEESWRLRIGIKNMIRDRE